MKGWVSFLVDQLFSLANKLHEIQKKFHHWQSVEERQIESLRIRLFSLGFTDEPLQELKKILCEGTTPSLRLQAALTIIQWYILVGTDESYANAINIIHQAHSISHNSIVARRLVVAELICRYQLKWPLISTERYEKCKSSQLSDVMLATANFYDLKKKLAVLNQVLKKSHLKTLSLKDGSYPVWHRLYSSDSTQTLDLAAKVTVIFYLENYKDALCSAIGSVQRQTWKNIEIILVISAEADHRFRQFLSAIQAEDSRIQLVSLCENKVRYSAYNFALDMATGDYVMLHSDNEWSHPQRVEKQARILKQNPKIVGCVAQNILSTPEFEYIWSKQELGVFIENSPSSLMFRRKDVTQRLGYWDKVDFGASEEFLERMSSAFGRNKICFMSNGPHLIIFVHSPIDRSPGEEFKIAGKCYGASRLYWEAKQNFLRASQNYLNNADDRSFPVPNLMRRHSNTFNYDVIIGSDFRMKGGSTQSSIQEIICHTRAGLKTGLMPMFRYDYVAGSNQDVPMVGDIWNQVDGERVYVVAYGEEVSCDVLILRYPPVLNSRQRFLPRVKAKKIVVVVNQTPMSDYGHNGVVRYDLPKCAENIRRYFNKEATWFPIGPLVRDALLAHHLEELNFVDLAENNWVNIIDVDEWDRGGMRQSESGRMRVGRHSRDDVTKWPDSKEQISAAYPTAGDIEVHILGGAKSAVNTLGFVPSNWHVHEFGSMSPRVFLAGIDVFIYFTSSALVESFGRVVMEAMAVGVPVILPEVYKPLFGEAALYAEPETAIFIASELYKNKTAYQSQVEVAQGYVRQKFGYEMHLSRLAELGVRMMPSS